MKMQTITLKNWTFYYDGMRFPCEPPCSMYGILLQEGKIPDPYYRDEEKKLLALAEKDCFFETEIEADGELLARERLLLCFDGIDTIADVTLNGRRLGHTENMHRRYEFDVKPYLTEGKNRLTVHIFSPLRYMREWQAKHYLAGNNESLDGVAHIRKASYMMGWDWGPVLPDMGIWRAVTLLGFDGARLKTPSFCQRHEGGQVRLFCHAETDRAEEGVKTVFLLRSPNGWEEWEEEADPDGDAVMTILHPDLWWPHGYGEQPLYEMAVRLQKNGELFEEKHFRIGLRTLTVSTAADAYGNEFCFVVNGKKIFSMGANYVPEDNILSRLTPARTEALLRQCVAANFNTIRVWGGGFYQNDWFYDLCDRLGLIVWQDFMVACNNVWLTEEREADLMAEFEDNLLRLRHHACIGLLNGNNEVEDSIIHSKPPRNTAQVVADYLRLYHRLLPGLCERLAPDIFYWPSSPSSSQNYDGRPADENRGDAHTWDVWHGWKPYESYRAHYYRFCSEFGFEALPDPATVARFTAPQDRNLFSPVLLAHQKCRMGNGKIMSYLSDYYLYPVSFDGVIYGSQLLQADAIRTAVEHFRRNRGRCMGALYWQLNDCWPTVSWSAIDSEGIGKALYYASKKFFAPVLLSAHEKGSDVTFNVSNETKDAFHGNIRLTVRTQDFATVYETKIPVSVAALSSADAAEVSFAEVIRGREADCYLTYTLEDWTGETLSEAVMLFVKPKCYHYRKPRITATVRQESATTAVLHLRSNTFAHKVYVRFSGNRPEAEDQYVNITSRQGTDIRLTYPDGVTAEDLTAKLSFFSVYNIAPECFVQ